MVLVALLRFSWFQRALRFGLSTILVVRILDPHHHPNELAVTGLDLATLELEHVGSLFGDEVLHGCLDSLGGLVRQLEVRERHLLLAFDGEDVGDGDDD